MAGASLACFSLDGDDNLFMHSNFSSSSPETNTGRRST